MSEFGLLCTLESKVAQFGALGCREGGRHSAGLRILLHHELQRRSFKLKDPLSGNSGQGIFQLEGPTLKLVMQENPKSGRVPTAFAAPEGSELGYFTFQRAK